MRELFKECPTDGMSEEYMDWEGEADPQRCFSLYIFQPVRRSIIDINSYWRESGLSLSAASGVYTVHGPHSTAILRLESVNVRKSQRELSKTEWLKMLNFTIGSPFFHRSHTAFLLLIIQFSDSPWEPCSVILFFFSWGTLGEIWWILEPLNSLVLCRACSW